MYFSQLVAEIRASGQNPELDSTLEEIPHELNSCIELVEEPLVGVDGFGRH